MNFALDARGINWYKGTGIGTYTDNLLKYMLKCCKEHEFHIFWCGENYDQYKSKNSNIIMTSKKHHRFFEQQYFPMYIKNYNVDLIHVPQNGISLYPYMPCKKIVTIHDLIPYLMPETVGKGYLMRFLKDMPEIISSADAVITVSKASKADILKFFPVDEKKIYVIPLAADLKYIPMDKKYCENRLKTELNICKPFILYVGGFSPRKNVKTILYAFKKSISKLDVSYDLVLAGSENEEAAAIKALAMELGIFDRVKFTGFVQEELMPVLYNGCKLFVYPSLYEGFGLPPLEAMACNTPVICSNLSSMPEVAGSGAVLINPNDVEALSCNMVKLLNNQQIMNNIKSEAEVQAKKFTWSNTAIKTLEVYCSI